MSKKAYNRVLYHGNCILYMETKWMAAGIPGIQLMAKVTIPKRRFSGIEKRTTPWAKSDTVSRKEMRMSQNKILSRQQ